MLMNKNTKTMGKRGLSLLLAMLICLGSFSISAFAEEPDEAVSAEVLSVVEETEIDDSTKENTFVDAATYKTRFKTGFEDFGSTDGIFNDSKDSATTWTVRFEMNGYGTQVPAQQIEPGRKATKPVPNPSQDGIVFYNWYADQECTTVFDFDREITDNTIVYARWRCIVTYDAAPGTVTISGYTRPAVKVYKDINQTAIFHAPNALDGYIFDKWYMDEAYDTPFDFNTPITRNTTLYAKWIPDFRIIEGNRGIAYYGSNYDFTLNYSFSNYSVNSGLFKVYVVRDGSEFGDALSQENYVITSNSEGLVVVTLKAAYINACEDAETYKIRFDTGLEDSGFTDGIFSINTDLTTTWTVSFENKVTGVTNWPINQQVPANGRAIRPTATPIAGDYVFDGWYADAGLKKIFDFTKAITNDTDIYAKWRCEVVFVTAHGATPTTQIVDINGTAKTPGNMSWIGYKWGGWTDEADNTFDFKTPITKNRTLYAKWIPDLKITIGDGGTAHYGSTYPFTLNYYFPDYNTNKDLFDVYIARSGSNYAVLNRDYYAVTQDLDKRVVVTLKASYIRTLTDGATYYILFDTGLPDPPTDLGATEGTFKVSKAPKTTSFVVTFADNGMVGATNMPPDQTVQSGGKAVRPVAIPSAEGYQFLDWFTDPEGTTAFDFNNTGITKNTIVYAKWVTNALRLPSGLTTIESEAFANVSAQWIIVPDSVEVIESRAFADCPNLLVLYFEGSPYTIALNTLSGSDNAAVNVIRGSSAEKWANRVGLTVIYRSDSSSEDGEIHDPYYSDDSTYNVITCPSCGQEVSMAYSDCPYCGYRIYG